MVKGTVQKCIYYKRKCLTAFVIVEMVDSVGKIIKIKGNTRIYPECGDDIDCIIANTIQDAYGTCTASHIMIDLPTNNEFAKDRLRQIIAKNADIDGVPVGKQFSTLYKHMVDNSGGNVWTKLRRCECDGIPELYLVRYRTLSDIVNRYINMRNSDTTGIDWFISDIRKYFESLDLNWKENAIRSIVAYILSIGKLITEAEYSYYQQNDSKLEFDKIKPEQLNAICPGDTIEENKHNMPNLLHISTKMYLEYINKLAAIGKANPDDILIAKLTVSLLNAEKEGHTCISAATYNHELPENMDMFGEYDEYLYRSTVYNEEVCVSETLSELNKLVRNISIEQIEEFLECKDKTFKPTAKQIEAIACAVNNGVSVIQGAAGTGKTTVSQLIVSVFNKLGSEIIFLAPTGKAVERMKECILGEDQKRFGTIHKYISDNHYMRSKKCVCNEHVTTSNCICHGCKGPCTYCVKRANFVEMPDVIIIDESSMLDLTVAAKLCKILTNQQIVFIGDTYQLPSVSYGSVLIELIKSIPSVTLNKVHRQEGDTALVSVIEAVKARKRAPEKSDKTYSYIPVVERGIEDCIKQWYSKIDREQSNVIITFRNTERLKLIPIVQNIINPMPKKTATNTLVFRETEFRVGDPVMQTKNDHVLNVYNGSIGKIVELGETEKIETAYNPDKGMVEYNRIVPFIKVEYKTNIIEYLDTNIDQLILSYVITIHKSQGSEYENVMFICYAGDMGFMNSKLAYTAISRAKKTCTILTTHSGMAATGWTRRATDRKSNLSAMIRYFDNASFGVSDEVL